MDNNVINAFPRLFQMNIYNSIRYGFHTINLLLTDSVDIVRDASHVLVIPDSALNKRNIPSEIKQFIQNLKIASVIF